MVSPPQASVLSQVEQGGGGASGSPAVPSQKFVFLSLWASAAAGLPQWSTKRWAFCLAGRTIKGFLPLVKLELKQLPLNSYSKGTGSRWLGVSSNSVAQETIMGKLR